MLNNNIQAYYTIKKLGKDLEFGKMENLIPQYLRSGIEVFSHQIYASSFALSNPFVKGFILADEAGLGKTMEALLIMAQFKIDKNKILVIVPTPTVDTWLFNIVRKFDYRCRLLDTKERPISENYIQSLKDFDDGIVLTTYDYVMANIEKFKEHDWQLCILDEAHRFRTYKIKENKTAEAIKTITPNAKKILLTATPIQKNEDDVFGLINFIDEDIFPDYDEFHKRYFRRPENYDELKSLIAPYTFRTLRSQVKVETKLPDRQILTQIYEMTDKEKRLYSLLEDYIMKDDKQAFPDMNPYDLSLMLYGTLSSSAYALSKTLSGIYTRLNKNPTAKAIEEAKTIKEMLELATTITSNNKDKMLIKALNHTFNVLSKKGIAQKCVLFTSSTQSQEHIEKYLHLNTTYSIFAFNGTTDDEPIKKFLKTENPAVLISTDKGNESLNWQDSAFVINYDFPQILLDMEQRISRCHRIGQATDVFVINFICPQNFSDVRMYELFCKRMRISGNIIGASDTIISGAVDGDIISNINDTLSNIRKKKEVQIAFADLQEEFKQELEDIRNDSNDILFNSFDKSIVEKTKNMADIIKKRSQDLAETMKNLARYYYKNDFINDNCFEFRSAWHRKNPYAKPSVYSLDGKDGLPFTLGCEPCQNMLISLQSSFSLKPQKLVLKNDGKIKVSSGYISCYDLYTQMGFNTISKTHLVGIDNNHSPLSEEICDQILNLECEDASDFTISSEIETTLDDEFNKVVPKYENELKVLLDSQSNLPLSHIKMQAEKERNAIDKEVKDKEREIDALKNATVNDNFEKIFAKNQKLSNLTKEYNKLREDAFFKKGSINKTMKQKIQEFLDKNAINCRKNKNFMIYFEIV